MLTHIASGSISSAELKAVMTGLGEKFTEKDIEDMIRVADKSGKGAVRWAWWWWWCGVVAVTNDVKLNAAHSHAHRCLSRTLRTSSLSSVDAHPPTLLLCDRVAIGVSTVPVTESVLWLACMYVRPRVAYPPPPPPPSSECVGGQREPPVLLAITVSANKTWISGPQRAKNRLSVCQSVCLSDG
jgi:hypothetical protein